MNLFRRRNRQRERQTLRRIQICRKVLAARSTCLDALHVAEHPVDVATLVAALDHLDLALDILLDRIPAGYVELRTRILERPPAV